MAIESILIVFGVALTVSFIVSEIFYRLKYPRVIGAIFAGIILGLPVIKQIFSANAFRDINFLSELGIIFLLMLAGLEINLRKLKHAEKDAFLIATFGAIVPLAMGYLFMIALGYSKIIAFVLGICLSLTAEGTTLKVLFDMDALNTRIGTTILGAGIIDDVFEVIFLSAILIIANRDIKNLIWFPAKLVFFIAVIFLVFKLIPLFIRFIQKERSRVATFSTILLIGLWIAIISQGLALGPIIGAFIAGIIIQVSIKNRHEEQENVEELKIMTFSFVIPFFFINMGLHLDFHSLLTNFWLMLSVTCIAIIGKVVGAVMVTPLTDLSLKQSYIIGWGMNSRGAVELVIAEIARINGLIPIEVYSSIIIMAILTTLMFPVVLKRYIKEDRAILD
ncbi:MAG: cation:proton antiporter [DPANN group archaeon]|nr:cation:proton antiporter [DPANN group archaeon]